MPAPAQSVVKAEVFELVRVLLNDKDALFLSDEFLEPLYVIALNHRPHQSTLRVSYFMCSLWSASRGSADCAQYFLALANG
jgi:hypothetical protein